MTAAELFVQGNKLPAQELAEFERMWTLGLAPDDVSRRLAVLRSEIQRGEDDFGAGRFTEMREDTFKDLRVEASGSEWKAQIPMTKVQGISNPQDAVDAVHDDWEAAESSLMVLRDGAAVNGEAKTYDLQERTALFGESVIRFLKRVPEGPRNNRLISQLVGAATSIGANYCEADEAVSKKEFRNKIGTCRKEAKETKFFLRMIAESEPTLRDEARQLWREARELHLIFCAIFRK